MNYEYPVITTLDRVLPHLDDNFSVKEKEGITYINYKVSSLEVFPPITNYASKVRRECRGIAFNEKGVVVSRPFHKFFNMNERPETTSPDFSQPHDVLEKLDGSMVRPIPMGDHVRWATKAGITEVSMLAEVYVAQNPKYEAFAREMFRHNLTPCFEFTAPDNRIVLPYGKPELTLLAIRDNWNGEYASYEGLQELASDFGIPVVKKVTLEFLQQEEDKEGVVVSFRGGMLKVKTEWYVKRHKAKELIDNERVLVQLILDDELDDVLPLVDEEGRAKLLDFQVRLWTHIKHLSVKLHDLFGRMQSKFSTKKDFAVTTSIEPNNPFRAWVFALWDQKVATPEEAVLKTIRQHLHTNKKYAEVTERLDLPKIGD